MGSVKQSIQIEVVAKTPFELKPKTSAIKELAKLDNLVRRNPVKFEIHSVA